LTADGTDFRLRLLYRAFVGQGVQLLHNRGAFDLDILLEPLIVGIGKLAGYNIELQFVQFIFETAALAQQLRSWARIFETGLLASLSHKLILHVGSNR